MPKRITVTRPETNMRDALLFTLVKKNETHLDDAINIVNHIGARSVKTQEPLTKRHARAIILYVEKNTDLYGPLLKLLGVEFEENKTYTISGPPSKIEDFIKKHKKAGFSIVGDEQ